MDLGHDSAMDLAPDLAIDLGHDSAIDLAPDLAIDLAPDLAPDLAIDLGHDSAMDSGTQMFYSAACVYHSVWCQIKRGGKPPPLLVHVHVGSVCEVLPLVVHVQWYTGRSVELCRFKWRLKVRKGVDQVDGAGRRAGVLQPAVGLIRIFLAVHQEAVALIGAIQFKGLLIALAVLHLLLCIELGIQHLQQASLAFSVSDDEADHRLHVLVLLVEEDFSCLLQIITCLEHFRLDESTCHIVLLVAVLELHRCRSGRVQSVLFVSVDVDRHLADHTQFFQLHAHEAAGLHNFGHHLELLHQLFLDLYTQLNEGVVECDPSQVAGIAVV